MDSKCTPVSPGRVAQVSLPPAGGPGIKTVAGGPGIKKFTGWWPRLVAHISRGPQLPEVGNCGALPQCWNHDRAKTRIEPCHVDSIASTNLVYRTSSPSP